MSRNRYLSFGDAVQGGTRHAFSLAGNVSQRVDRRAMEARALASWMDQDRTSLGLPTGRISRKRPAEGQWLPPTGAGSAPRSPAGCALPRPLLARPLPSGSMRSAAGSAWTRSTGPFFRSFSTTNWILGSSTWLTR